MTSPFDPSEGLIVVTARIHGPAGSNDVRLALDTGATVTVISREWLSLVGYDLNDATQLNVITGSGRESASRVVLDRIETLDMEKISLPILAYSLPESTTVDGALGLDFFEDCRLTIDFRQNTIDVE
jgi:hypothetical protein